MLERAIEALAAEPMAPSLARGFTGIAWAAAHLSMELDHAELDEALVASLAAPWSGYALLDGMAGAGVYALERLPDPGAAAVLAAVVDRLREIAVAKPAGKAFWTRPDTDEPRGGYVTGVARGIAGVIAVLAGACAWDVAADRARPLLDDTVAWLRVARLADEAVARYPRSWAPGSEARPAPCTWCDGDPGIAAALLAAARAVGERSWEADAIELALLAARRPIDDARGAGLCHGAAGVGHALDRIYQATGEPVLREAARAWLARAIATRDGDPGLLDGGDGIALAITAAASNVEPAWDRCFAMSLRVPSVARDRAAGAP
jgi:hypothetical protein